jgi:hypothetical protein
MASNQFICSEEMEVQKERERRYYEGIEAALQQYYATVIEELKQKVRDARAQNGYTGKVTFLWFSFTL